MSDTHPKPRRQRAILSCNDCRRRKLKCHRLAPCNRCIKGRVAQSCTYGPGKGTEYFCYVSAAVSLVDTQFQPSQSISLKRQASDRVAKLLHKSMSLLDDPTEETLATEVVLAATPKLPTSMNPQVTAEPPAISTIASSGLELDPLNFEDTTESMLDDLWFLNIPPLDEHWSGAL